MSVCSTCGATSRDDPRGQFCSNGYHAPMTDALRERVARALVEREFGKLTDAAMDEWMAKDGFAKSYRDAAQAALDATPIAEMREEIERLREALLSAVRELAWADNELCDAQETLEASRNARAAAALIGINRAVSHINKARAALGDGKVVT